MLKKTILASFIVVVIFITGYYVNKKVLQPFRQRQHAKHIVKMLDGEQRLQNYDVIFQTSQSAQSKAIQLATHSAYSHCGIIHWEAGDCFVWEACNGVEATSIEDFISRGKGQHFVIKRLKNPQSVFSDAGNAQRMDSMFYKYVNRPYDLYFGWGDDRLYCSELVWKIYKQATGIELGKLHQLKDFDLSNPVVQQKMKQRYGSNIPLNELVISPADIFNSNELKTVKVM